MPGTWEGVECGSSFALRAQRQQQTPNASQCISKLPPAFSLLLSEEVLSAEQTAWEKSGDFTAKHIWAQSSGLPFSGYDTLGTVDVLCEVWFPRLLNKEHDVVCSIAVG